MVRRNLASDINDARKAIQERMVLVGGAVASNPDRQVASYEPIRLLDPPSRYVSRGGEKLEAALREFTIAVAGKAAIDVGASTGGFTDCLLQHGATGVVAIDVGYGQLHERLRADERVHNLERTTIRGLDVATVGGPVPLVVGDLSFISLRRVAADLEQLGTKEAEWVLLVKPQFEAERQEADRGRGVIRDPAIWERVLHEVKSTFASYGLYLGGAMVSPITGKDGNTEFLVKFTRIATNEAGHHLDAAIAATQLNLEN